MRMTSNNVRPITMKEGFLAFNFHPQFQSVVVSNIWLYESRQKVKINPLINFLKNHSKFTKPFSCLIIFWLPSRFRIERKVDIIFWPICRITNIAEIIISEYGTRSNSILVDVMEYDMRSTGTSIVKMWEIEWCVILTKHLYKVGKED